MLKFHVHHDWLFQLLALNCHVRRRVEKWEILCWFFVMINWCIFQLDCMFMYLVMSDDGSASIEFVKKINVYSLISFIRDFSKLKHKNSSSKWLEFINKVRLRSSSGPFALNLRTINFYHQKRKHCCSCCVDIIVTLDRWTTERRTEISQSDIINFNSLRSWDNKRRK